MLATVANFSVSELEIRWQEISTSIEKSSQNSLAFITNLAG
jgi:hypothetical protein